MNRRRVSKESKKMTKKQHNLTNPDVSIKHMNLVKGTIGVDENELLERDKWLNELGWGKQ